MKKQLSLWLKGLQRLQWVNELCAQEDATLVIIIMADQLRYNALGRHMLPISELKAVRHSKSIEKGC